MTRAPSFLLLLVALLASVAYGIFEDQAGEFDWSVTQLGRVTTVASQGQGRHASVVRGTSRAVYVGTDERSRAIARLDAKTGAIKWRRVLHEGDSIDTLQLTNFGLISISGAGKNVRLWDSADGVLLWDAVSYSNAPATTFANAFAIGDDRIVVLTSTGAAQLNLKDGSIAWRAAFATALTTDSISSELSSDGTTLFVLTTTQLLRIELKTGAVKDISASYTRDSSAVATALVKDDQSAVVALSLASKGFSLQSLEKTGTRASLTIADIQLPASKTPEEFVALESNVKGSFVLQLTSGKRVYAKISSSLAVDVVSVISRKGRVVESSNDDGTLFHVAVDASGKKVEVTPYAQEAVTAGMKWEAEFDTASFGGKVANAFVSCPTRSKESGVLRCRALFVMQDDALIMSAIDDSSADQESSAESETPTRNVLWVREEALANIKQVRWITPAETDIEKQPLKGIPSFSEELVLEAARIQHMAESIASFATSLFETKRKSNEARARKEPTNAHAFGFSKFIVALTESGKLFAIRAEASTVAWSVFVGPDYTLFVTRDHPALGAGAELLLVSKSSHLRWFDGDDGHEIEAADAGKSDEETLVVMLPKRKHHVDEADASLRRAIAVISKSSLEAAMYPAASNAGAYPELENFYFYRFDAKQNALRGYVIEDDGKASVFHAREVWSVVLPQNQVLTASSHQTESVVVDSAVTITGDDSLLLKYLNPNLFAIATLSTEQLEGGNTASVLHVTLLDSVVGRVIHRVRHTSAAGPVRMVQSENWLVYSFWSTKDKRTELVSLSLFDGAIGTHSLNPWKRPSWSESRSSYDSRAPFVLQKSFIYPAKISTLGVTVTSRGITPQFVLVGMENGQIFKLPRNVIDPRQTDAAPNAEEQSEGLLQYSPLVPVYNNALSMVTYNKTIENLKAITTNAAQLESTTLVFAYGLDLFYVRMAPAKSFDLLPSDFNYEMLILLCIGFIVATVISKNLAQRKVLREAWK